MIDRIAAVPFFTFPETAGDSYLAIQIRIMGTIKYYSPGMKER